MTVVVVALVSLCVLCAGIAGYCWGWVDGRATGEREALP